MPVTSQALVLNEPADIRLRIEEVTLPPLKPGEVLIKMAAAALNHRDEWIRKGQYAGIVYSAILGSDGCGIVQTVANDADQHWVGKSVIINPNNDWGPNPTTQSAQYNIRGLQTHGTFAQHLIVPAHRLQTKPDHLTAAQAAAIPLGGLTAYRAAISYGRPQPQQKVLITGIGGGVALFAFQFAKASGAACWVTSGDDAKIEKAIALGAVQGGNYKEPDYWKKLKKESGGFDLIIDSAGGEGFNLLIEMCKSAGQIVVYGATQALPKEINLRKIFWNQLRIQGSTMGNDIEFADMVAFINKYQIVPVVDSVRPFVQILEALADMRSGKQFGKLVVTF